MGIINEFKIDLKILGFKLEKIPYNGQDFDEPPIFILEYYRMEDIKTGDWLFYDEISLEANFDDGYELVAHFKDIVLFNKRMSEHIDG